jgi:hypothetical protein
MGQICFPLLEWRIRREGDRRGPPARLYRGGNGGQTTFESGFAQMADAVRIIRNEAMRIERSRVLEAEPYQRSGRRGYANGFNPKTLERRACCAMTLAFTCSAALHSAAPRLQRAGRQLSPISTLSSRTICFACCDALAPPLTL